MPTEAIKDTPQAVSLLRQAILLDPENVNLYLDFANLSLRTTPLRSASMW